MQFNNLSVVEFNNIIKNIFDSEEMLFNCTVIGEISSYKITNNIAYYTIKDDFSVLNCVWFGANKEFRIGEKVKVMGSPNYYVKGGKLNFNTMQIISFGEGDIYRRFLELKQKLLQEGYFINKKELPRTVQNIGVVTSSRGAAIKDIISVVKRRNPSVNVFVYPALVQGEKAANEIVRGLEFFDNFEVDVVIVARGGGSNEDLSAFNTESVAKACYKSQKPIISAVGHETDWTLIDLVADVRAPTPSVGAEIAVKESKDYAIIIGELAYKLKSAICGKIEKISAKTKLLLGEKVVLSNKTAFYRSKIENFGYKFKEIMSNYLLVVQNKIGELKHKNEVLNPLLFTQKGYAMIEKNNKKVTSTSEVLIGDELEINLKDGKILAKALEIKKWI